MTILHDIVYRERRVIASFFKRKSVFDWNHEIPATLTDNYFLRHCHFQYKTSGVGGVKGGRVPPLTAKNLPKIGKKRENSEKSGKKEEKSRRKDKNREGSFTLPLLTDRAGYATVSNVVYLRLKIMICRVPFSLFSLAIIELNDHRLKGGITSKLTNSARSRFVFLRQHTFNK